MTDELKPVPCGCGGEAQIAKKYLIGNLPDVYVLCGNCSIRTGEYYSEAEAIEAWNKAMSARDSVPYKKGKWIKIGHWGRSYRCSKCGNTLDFDGVNVGRGDANYCPNCGAEMRGNR